MLTDQSNFLFITTLVFLIGLSGVMLNRKNIILMLMSLELILLAINLNLIVFSFFLDDIIGQVFALFILTVAAAESAIGLALLLVYYRVRGTVSIDFVNLLKG